MAVIDRPAVYAAPGEAGSPVSLKPRYENFIGGDWVAPLDGQHIADDQHLVARAPVREAP